VLRDARRPGATDRAHSKSGHAVDQNSGRVTIRDANGGTHKFQAKKETVKDMKPGDKIEAKLREAPKC
jgi:hypothetical protein